MGNPWLFATLAALDRGEPAPPEPTLAERRRVWRRHADLVAEYSVERMRVHELRKTLAWYSRGLRGGSDLRQRANQSKHPAALLDMGEAFFAGLLAIGDGTHALTGPADPVAKSKARQGRKGGAHTQAPEPSLV